MDLRRHYLAYLDTLNERRFDDLVEYVADELTYNDRPMTLQDYRDLLEGDVAAIPDLRFDVGILVVSDDRVACRIDFDCTPVAPFLGFDPPGHRAPVLRARLLPVQRPPDRRGALTDRPRGHPGPALSDGLGG